MKLISIRPESAASSPAHYSSPRCKWIPANWHRKQTPPALARELWSRGAASPTRSLAFRYFVKYEHGEKKKKKKKKRCRADAIRRVICSFDLSVVDRANEPRRNTRDFVLRKSAEITSDARANSNYSNSPAASSPSLSNFVFNQRAKKGFPRCV